MIRLRFTKQKPSIWKCILSSWPKTYQHRLELSLLGTLPLFLFGWVLYFCNNPLQQSVFLNFLLTSCKNLIILGEITPIQSEFPNTKYWNVCQHFIHLFSQFIFCWHGTQHSRTHMCYPSSFDMCRFMYGHLEMIHCFSNLHDLWA